MELLLEMLIQGLYIAIPTTVIIDAAGFMEWVKEKLYYIRYSKSSLYEPYSMKPFDCSMCLSMWLYVIIFWQPTIFIIVGAGMATLLALTIRKYIIL